MEPSLKENRQHGTASFPIQMYRMKNYTRDISVSYHWHEEIEMIYMIRGKLSLRINGQKYIGRPGDIFIINKEDLHEFHTKGYQAYYYAFVFPIDFLFFDAYDYTQNRYFAPLRKNKLSIRTHIDSRTPLYDKICCELLELIQSFQAKNNGYQIFAKSSLLRIFSYFIQGDLIISNEKEQRHPDDYKAEELRRILQYIQTHYQDHLFLDDIAREFNMSAKYFCRYFKNHFEKTFVEYVNDYRVNQAAELLITTDQKIMDIAMQVGFDNFSYFIKRFKKITGTTPSQYRKMRHPNFMPQHP